MSTVSLTVKGDAFLYVVVKRPSLISIFSNDDISRLQCLLRCVDQRKESLPFGRLSLDAPILSSRCAKECFFVHLLSSEPLPNLADFYFLPFSHVTACCLPHHQVGFAFAYLAFVNKYGLNYVPF